MISFMTSDAIIMGVSKQVPGNMPKRLQKP